MREAELVAANTLVNQPMPDLAAALRKRTTRVVDRWNKLVRSVLPSADALTSQQVRDSIPAILKQMADAIESGQPEPTEELGEMTKIHGEARFHESYNTREVILEYRLLRKVLIEEIDHAFKRPVTAQEWMALDIAVDLAMQEAVLAFLQHQGSRLKAATDGEAKFLGFLAHEIRGGLNSVMLTMQWVEHALESHKEFKEEREALIAARKSATETVTSLERLLQAERLRQKTTAPVYTAISLRTIAEKVTTQLKVAAQRKGIAVHVQIPEGAIVNTDGGLLTLILQNLVTNAVSYSDSGKVTLRARRSNGDWLLEVGDEGPGMDEDLIAKIVSACARGETPTGNGLGLFIAYQAAETLGARITVESSLGDGSTFTIALPSVKPISTRQNSA